MMNFISFKNYITLRYLRQEYTNASFNLHSVKSMCESYIAISY